MLGCSKTTKGGPIESKITLDGYETGLLAGHAYAILDAFELPEISNKEKRHRLIRIRNPWGFGEWKLKWSDNDEKLRNNLERIIEFYK